MDVKTRIRAGAFAAGLAASVGQVLVLRESLVLFHGYELSTGLVLACWLFWTGLGSLWGTRPGGRNVPRASHLVPAFLLLALAVPGSVLWIRAGRLVWSLPPGELAGLGTMLGASVTGTAPAGLASGALFAFLWRLARASAPGKASGVYAAEAAGAAAGGLLFHFLFLPLAPVLDAALMTACVPAAAALLFARQDPPEWKGFCFIEMLGLVLVLAAAAALYAGPIERASRLWQWGPDFVRSVDTPRQNLALLKNGDQASLFGDGLWIASLPDAKTEETSVHPTLLEHPAPTSVLLVGGSPALPREVLKHPSVTHVVELQPDEAVPRLFAPFETDGSDDGSRDPRVRVIAGDPRVTLAAGPESYDVIFLNIGEPLNAGLNRFFTEEFFQQVRRCLNPGGILSVALPAALDMPGPIEARFLGVLKRTLGAAFPDVLPLPGEMARLLASTETGVLTKDVDLMAARLAERRISSGYVRDDWIRDQMNPMRFAYLEAVLGTGEGSGINRDFDPLAFRHVLALWAAQVFPGWLGEASSRDGRTGTPAAPNDWSRVAIGAAGLALFAVFGVLWWAGRKREVVLLNSALTGSALMGCEVGVLFVFQVLAGFLYAEIALIVAAFMAGAAVGASETETRRRRGKARTGDIERLLRVQAALGVFLFLLVPLFRMLHKGEAFGGVFSTGTALSILFALLALAAGVLGGAHFRIAAGLLERVSAEKEAAPGSEPDVEGRAGGVLYGWDLAGAALGSLAASVLMIPAFGFEKTFLIFAGLLVAGSGALLIAGGEHRGRGKAR